MRKSKDKYQLGPKRCNRLKTSWKIVALKSFKELTLKKLCQNLSFNKVTGFRPGTLLKRESDTNIFLWILENFSEQSF